jgi:hypothetical protein
LFQGNINDPEVKTIDDLNNSRSKISLDRLAMPKKYGGMNLRRIEDIFSASKTKVLMRALQDNGKMKPCNILLFKRSGYYFSKESKDQIVHPFYLVEQNSRKFNCSWEWYKQAYRIYTLIDKDCTTIPEIGDSLFDWHKDEIIYFDGQDDVDLYQTVNKTIPVELKDYQKRRLAEKKENYLKIAKKSRIDKIVTIGHRKNTPVRIAPTKTRATEWMKKVKVTFNQMEEKKLNKINLRNIFKVTIDEYLIPIYTDRQKDWIKEGVNLKALFSNSLKCVSRIDDFKRKFLMSYWGKLEENCCLCGEPYNRMHLFKYCRKVEKWEDNVYMQSKEGDIKTIRQQSMLEHSLTSHTLSWIYNWCIWKNYWQVKYKQFENSESEENQIENFKELIKFNEYLHLKYSNATVNKNKIELVAQQTKYFSFFVLGKEHVAEAKKEAREEKKRKNSCYSYMKKRKENKKKRQTQN